MLLYCGIGGALLVVTGAIWLTTTSKIENPQSAAEDDRRLLSKKTVASGQRNAEEKTRKGKQTTQASPKNVAGKGEAGDSSTKKTKGKGGKKKKKRGRKRG